MSAAAERPDPASSEPTERPRFELKFLVDDAVEPTELTIFSPDEDDITTHWITVDFDHAVAIQAVR